ncbi:MAG: molybdopterin molybdotransferase MoeA [Candidatus Nezhaarchaeota archaeon]|nr:molybdopterin molybdotransferase MoeA [Candidatus Nezhaarchaeota archaeon]
MKAFRRLVKVHEAVSMLLESFKGLEPPSVDVPLTLSYGRIASRDIVAPIDVPHFNRSAVDGYALKAELTFGASRDSPKRFKVLSNLDEVGQAQDPLIAIKVATGQFVPEGFDAVVMSEVAPEVDGFIEVSEPIPPLRNVSVKGEDVKEGTVIVEKGTVIGPQQMGIMASCGLTKAPVYRKIRVLIVSSGEEVKRPGEALKNHEIYDSSSFIVYGLVKKYFSQPFIYPKSPIPSSSEEVLEALHYGLKGFDVVIFIGGTSVGSRDIIPQVLSSEGELLFHGVAMKPGKPTAALKIHGKPVFCLPGPPVSCFFSFIEIVGPLIERMYSLKESVRCKLRARLKRNVPGEVGSRVYVRVILRRSRDGLEAEPIATGGSSVISSICRAQGYIVVPEDVDSLSEGEEVDVYPLVI